MSKKIFFITIIIILIGVIVVMVIPKEEKKQIENTVSDIMQNTEPKTQTGELTLLINKTTNYNQNGYYYIHMGEDKYNIKYFDYEAKKEIYLCNKPNCHHDTKECNSYLDIMGDNKMIAYDNKLYLMSSMGEVQVMDSGANTSMMNTMPSSSPTLYQMSLEGTQKTKVWEAPSGTNMVPCIIEKNALYAFLTKNKSIATGTNSTTQMETERKLIKINLSTGKYEEIKDCKNQSVIGVYKDSIILEEIEYKEDPEKFLKDDTAAIRNINQSTRKIKRYNLVTKQETEIYQDKYSNMETIDSAGAFVYFTTSKSKTIEYVNIETNEKGTLVALPKSGANFQGIYNNRLLYLYYDTSSNEGKVEKAYYVDLQTKENKEFKLLDHNRQLVEILATYGDSYFLKIEDELTDEYTTWAGTKQRDIKSTHYGLIHKEDYWASKANYLKMKNTED